jgi:hypothetical protein
MEGFLELWAVFDDPPVDGRVIHVDPTFKHEFFDVARAQRVGDIPADAHQNNVWWEMGPIEADRHRLAPPLQYGLEGDHTTNRLKRKLATEPGPLPTIEH